MFPLSPRTALLFPIEDAATTVFVCSIPIDIRGVSDHYAPSRSYSLEYCCKSNYRRSHVVPGAIGRPMGQRLLVELERENVLVTEVTALVNGVIHRIVDRGSIRISYTVRLRYRIHKGSHSIYPSDMSHICIPICAFQPIF